MTAVTSGSLNTLAYWVDKVIMKDFLEERNGVPFSVVNR